MPSPTFSLLTGQWLDFHQLADYHASRTTLTRPTELPKGWCLTKLGEIAEWGAGGTPSRKNSSFYGGNVPWIKTGDLGAKIIRQSSEFITEEAVAKSSAKLFLKGSVAIAMYGATIGKTSILGIDATTNQACGVGHPIAQLTTTEFLYYFLCNEKDNFIAKGKGGAQPNISQGLIKEHEVILPPLAEQQQIAAKLDELLAQVDILKTRLDTIPKILKRFRQSVLAAAVSGKLTEDWRGNNVYADGYPTLWEKKGLSEYGKLSRGKSKHRPRNDLRLFGDQYPFIQTGEISNSGGRISSATKFYSEFGLAQSKLFPSGTLCITIAANIADTAILDIDACFPDSVVGFSPDKNKCVIEFVKYLIDANKANLEEFAPATAQKNINLKVLNELHLPFPSFEEQTEIVTRVEQLFTYADQIEQRVKDAQARVNHLTQAILAKAFRGELTADWREQNPDLITGENSAETLLAKIKAERETIATPKKTKKKAKV